MDPTITISTNLSSNGGVFEINQLLFADDTELVADSEEKLRDW